MMQNTKSISARIYVISAQVFIWIYVLGATVPMITLVSALGRGLRPSTFGETTDMVWAFFRLVAFAFVGICLSAGLRKSVAQMLVSLAAIRWLVLPPVYALGGAAKAWGIPFAGFADYSKGFGTEDAVFAFGILFRDIATGPLLILGVWSLVLLIRKSVTDKKSMAKEPAQEEVL